MSKGFGGLYGLSIKKSAMTNVKARQHVLLMSTLIYSISLDLLDMEW